MTMQPPVAGWLFEIVGPLVWLVMAGYYVRECRRSRTLTVPALVFIGATSMFWLEWYGDWAAYLLYNPHLQLIDGWDAPLTSGNKPWAVIPAYGWFFGLIYFPIIAGMKRAYFQVTGVRVLEPGEMDPESRVAPSQAVATDGAIAVVEAPAAVRTKRPPRLSFPVTLFLAGLLIHWAWDVIVEGAATQAGLWTYVHTVGPTVHGSRGVFPLLYPAIPFALQMSLTMLLIHLKRPDGTPLVESWTRVDRLTGFPRTVGRIVTWILTMNLTYLMLFIGPVGVIRVLFLPGNALVP